MEEIKGNNMTVNLTTGTVEFDLKKSREVTYVEDGIHLDVV